MLVHSKVFPQDSWNQKNESRQVTRMIGIGGTKKLSFGVIFGGKKTPPVVHTCIVKKTLSLSQPKNEVSSMCCQKACLKYKCGCWGVLMTVV